MEKGGVNLKRNADPGETRAHCM